MISLLTTILIAIAILVLSQLYLNKIRPVTKLGFVSHFVSVFIIIGLIWFLNGVGGNVPFKIIATIVGLVTIIQHFLSYKKGKLST